MSENDWKVVQVVVYPPRGTESARLEQEVRLPRDAGLEELLGALEIASPDVHTEVCECVARASSGFGGPEGDAAPLQTLDRYFALGGPIVCPDVTGEIA